MEAEPTRSSVNACLICGGGQLSESVSGVEDFFFGNVRGEFDFARCDQCESLVLVNPLDEAVLPEAYSQYYTHAAAKPSNAIGLRQFMKRRYLEARFGASAGVFSKMIAAIFKWLASDFDTIDRAGRYGPSAPARILDYGCGGGAFLKDMRDFGNHVTGVDFDPVAVRNAREDGLEILTPDTIPYEEWREKFDFVSLSHVIEHVPDPKRLIGQLSHWLKPGGTLFLETPNARAHGLLIFGKYWRGLEAPRHLCVPSGPGLLKLASDAGLVLERQILSRSLRSYLWQECLGVVDQEDRGKFIHQMETAPDLNFSNSEFLTFVFAKEPAPTASTSSN